MTATSLNVGHQSPQSGLPPLSQKVINTFVWGNGATTVTITDPYSRVNSSPQFWVTGTVPQAGQWAYNFSTPGQFTITSSDSESSTLTVSYVLE